CAAVPALAQQAPASLPDTVVTANRTPTRVDSLVSDVTVIERAELDKMAGQSLTEVLVRAAGVQMATNGGRGKSGNIFIRGTESRNGRDVWMAHQACPCVSLVTAGEGFTGCCPEYKTVKTTSVQVFFS